MQRRRAAKTARRIASLPSSLFESGVVVEPRTGTWSAMAPTVIDIPSNAIHETPRAGELPAAFAADVDVIDVEVVEVDAPAASLFTPEPDVAEAEAPAHDAGRATVIGARWRAWKAGRNGNRNSNGNGNHAAADDEVETETVADQPYDWEADKSDASGRRGPTSWIPDRWRTWRPMPDDAETAAPSTPAAVAPEPPAAPPPPRRRGRIEPREVAPAAHFPKGAENWQPSESLWAKRVFNSRAQGGEVARWPRSRPPKQDVTAGE
jgi:hypothetical protein